VRFTAYGIRDGKRSRLARVRVRLGGKSVRTNRRGRAGLTVRFHRAGRKRARATRSGYRSARAFVRVTAR
jgi:hypothetical protein